MKKSRKSTSKKKATKPKQAAKKGKQSSRSAKPKMAAKRARGASQRTEIDVVEMILEHHRPLKQLIEIMKDSERALGERKKAFEEFAPLLVAHAKPEEKAVYMFMKRDIDLREEGFEGDVEHALADQLVEETKRTSDEEQMGARIKVLAELVEHHIKEEEEDLLPDLEKQTTPQERSALGEKYSQLRLEIQAEGSDDAPHERDLEDASGRASHM